ncbi:MAG TPA: hypothetical protein VGM24_03585, partial [Puia sp.]
MKKIPVCIGLVILFHGPAFSQKFPGEVDSSFLPVLQMHYQAEYTFDSPLDNEAWQNQQGGLHVSFGSTDRAYFRTEVPEKKETLEYEGVGWRGERLNTKLLIWFPDTLQQVRITVNDLVSADGKHISGKNISLNLVRYVLANYPYGSKEKIRILKELAGRSPNKNIQAHWQAFEKYLGVFPAEHEFNEEKITAEVNKGKALLDELSDLMSQ